MALVDRVTFGLSHLAWGVDLSDERAFRTFVEDASAIGVDGILIFDVTAQAWYGRSVAFRRLLADHGLRLVGAIYRAGLDFRGTRDLAAWIAEAGGTHMPITGRTGGEAEWGIVVPALARHGAIAAEHGVAGLYHHNTAAIAPTMALTERLLAETDPRALGGMIDCGHATKDFPDGPAAAFIRRNQQRIAYVEVKDWHPDTDLCTEVGQGRCDWPDVAAALDECAYAGWLVVEQNGRPPDPRAAASRSLAFTRRLIASR